MMKRMSRTSTHSWWFINKHRMHRFYIISTETLQIWVILGLAEKIGRFNRTIILKFGYIVGWTNQLFSFILFEGYISSNSPYTIFIKIKLPWSSFYHNILKTWLSILDIRSRRKFLITIYPSLHKTYVAIKLSIFITRILKLMLRWWLSNDILENIS